MRIYTRTGDAGETGLFGAGRVRKDHPLIEVCGAVDELNATLSHAVAEIQDAETTKRLRTVQEDLFILGSHLAAPTGGDALPPLPDGRVEEMEAWIDEADGELPPLRSFILPGGTAAARHLHVARTVCRRAERTAVSAGADDTVRFSTRYLNRLADVLFTLARLENHRAGEPDVVWRGRNS